MDMLIDETLAAELVGRDDVTSEVLRRLTYAENDLKMAMDTDEETESRSGHAVSFRVLMNEVRDFCEKLDKMPVRQMSRVELHVVATWADLRCRGHKLF